MDSYPFYVLASRCEGDAPRGGRRLVSDGPATFTQRVNWVLVLFKDRELVADDGYFIDDFRGHDLYQRFGGGYGVGYGNGPVALHLYELESP